MKKQWIFKAKPPYDPHFWELTRADLDPDELEIYDALLPKLDNSVPEQLLSARQVTFFDDLAKAR